MYIILSIRLTRRFAVYGPHWGLVRRGVRVSGVTHSVEFQANHGATQHAVAFMQKQKELAGFYIAQNFRSAMDAVESLAKRLTLRAIDV